MPQILQLKSNSTKVRKKNPKLSEIRKQYWRTHPLTEEQKKAFGKRIAKAITGKKRSPEHCLAISKAKKGAHFSQEALKKIREAARKRWEGYVSTSPWKNKVRGCYLYTEWRNKIRLKYNFTCALCGQRGGKLEIDHYPRLFSEIIKENKINSFEEAVNCPQMWDLSNGRLLCVLCHKSVTIRLGRPKKYANT